MKVLNSASISSFGGLNFVLEELSNLNIDRLINRSLPELPVQSQYSWKDILYSYWSILFCGGDCAEDISVNLGPSLAKSPFVKAPSPDRLLARLKELSDPVQHFKERKGKVENDFSMNDCLNTLNIKLLKRMSALKETEKVLDYDNTFIFTDKSDAKYTYYKQKGYCPGVGIIGNNIVYVENRNGNCAPHTLQDKTIERIFELLNSQNIKVESFRADSAAYQFEVINTVSRYTKRFYIRAKMKETIYQVINSIEHWERIGTSERLRASGFFTPFFEAARKTNQKDLLQQYRLVITKEPRKDRQINLFTGEAFEYSAILTNDFEKGDNEIVHFYDQRGKQEREFDVLKNDFAWDKLPFSKLEENTVFLIVSAMCRNIYNYIIYKFSRRFKNLRPEYRIKKFIFRFICIPAKWVTTGRTNKLRTYGTVHFKT
jgi:hypothetical protein